MIGGWRVACCRAFRCKSLGVDGIRWKRISPYRILPRPSTIEIQLSGAAASGEHIGPRQSTLIWNVRSCSLLSESSDRQCIAAGCSRGEGNRMDDVGPLVKRSGWVSKDFLRLVDCSHMLVGVFALRNLEITLVSAIFRFSQAYTKILVRWRSANGATSGFQSLLDSTEGTRVAVFPGCKRPTADLVVPTFQCEASGKRRGRAIWPFGSWKSADRFHTNGQLTLVEIQAFLGHGTFASKEFGRFAFWLKDNFKTFDQNRNGLRDPRVVSRFHAAKPSGPVTNACRDASQAKKRTQWFSQTRKAPLMCQLQ